MVTQREILKYKGLAIPSFNAYTFLSFTCQPWLYINYGASFGTTIITKYANVSI